MAKKASKKSETSSPSCCPAYKPEPSADFSLVGGLPDGLPEVSKPVSILVTGTLSRVSMNEYPGEKSSNVRLNVKSLTVQNKKKA